MICLLLSAIAVGSSWLFFNVSVSRAESRAGAETALEGYVIEKLESASYQSKYAVRVTELCGEHTNEKMLLICNFQSDMQIGDGFRLNGELASLADGGAYRENTALYADGYIGAVYCDTAEDCTVQASSSTPAEVFFSKWKMQLSRRLSDAVGGEAGELASALLLGDRSGLSEKTVLDFRRAGVSHLLALSGLHVSVLLGVLSLLCFWVPIRVRALLVPIISIFYLFLTGCSPSAFRAVLMALGLYMGILFLRDYDSFTSICTALAVILIVTPYSILDISLWLSFAAAASIVVFYPATASWMAKKHLFAGLPAFLKKLLSALISALVIGIFANAAILPFSAIWFGTTSVFSVPVTMLLSPILAPALVLSLLSLLLPSLHPFTVLCGLCMNAMRDVAARVSDISNGTVLLGGAVCSVLLAILGAVLILFAVCTLRQKKLLFLPAFLSIAILFCGYADVVPCERGIGMTYLQDGRKNEMLLFSKGRRAVAVDLSNGAYTIGTELLDAVLDVKCTELEELVLTHYHANSVNLLSAVAARIKTRRLRLPLPNGEAEQELAGKITEAANQLGMAVICGNDAMVFDEMQILYADRLGQGGRACSLLLLIRIGEQHITYLSAGITDETFREILQNLSYSADFLILGSHGKKGSDEIFLPNDLGKTAEVILCGEETDCERVRTLLSKEAEILCAPMRYQTYFQDQK